METKKDFDEAFNELFPELSELKINSKEYNKRVNDLCDTSIKIPMDLDLIFFRITAKIKSLF